jgi:hypothetical protein
MKVRLPIFIIFFFFLHFSLAQPSPCFSKHFSKDSSSLLVKNGNQLAPKEDSKQETSAAIEEYEKEKLAKMKKNIGRRLLTVKTVNPAEFYESPDDLERKLKIKREKEGFVIMEVVQNQSGTMNFYRVKFDTGQIGYLSADGNYLEIKIKEGGLISAPKRANVSKKSLSQSRALSSQAVELVKNHLTPSGSVEKRMMEERAKSFPYPRWRYEAKEIGGKKFRVLQYVEERSAPPFIRTWIVDLSTSEVKPENQAAKEMYR